MIAASGGLKTRVLAIFCNHYRGNPRRLGRAKAGKAILNHQTLAGVEIELPQRRELHRRVRFAAWFIIRAGDRVKKVPERKLVQHSGNNLTR